MTQMLELSDKDFRAAIIKMIQKWGQIYILSLSLSHYSDYILFILLFCNAFSFKIIGINLK